jgi:hypothetical protein
MFCIINSETKNAISYFNDSKSAILTFENLLNQNPNLKISLIDGYNLTNPNDKSTWRNLSESVVVCGLCHDTLPKYKFLNSYDKQCLYCSDCREKEKVKAHMRRAKDLGISLEEFEKQLKEKKVTQCKSRKTENKEKSEITILKKNPDKPVTLIKNMSADEKHSYYKDLYNRYYRRPENEKKIVIPKCKSVSVEESTKNYLQYVTNKIDEVKARMVEDGKNIFRFSFYFLYKDSKPVLTKTIDCDTDHEKIYYIQNGPICGTSFTLVCYDTNEKRARKRIEQKLKELKANGFQK